MNRKYFLQALRSTSALTLLAAALLGPQSANAADLVISTAETTYNGGLTIGNGDTFTITSTGSIIMSAGNDALRISPGGALTGVTGYNYGMLETSGNSISFSMENNNAGTNFGTIKGSGIENIGMAVGSHSSMTNAGTITSTATGPHAAAMWFWSTDNIGTNSGTITKTGGSGANFGETNDNTFTNTGTINISGSDGIGIALQGSGANWAYNNIVNNSGIISASGGATTAISMGNGETGQAANTLNLLAGSQITGLIDAGGDNVATIVNIETTKSNEVLWQFAGTMEGAAPTITGDALDFYNATTMQFAALNPDNFTANSDEVSTLSGLISGVTQNRLSTGGSGNTLGYAAATTTIIDETFAEVETINQGWAKIVGAYADYSDTNSTQKQLAVIAGYDVTLSTDTILGFMAGFGRGTLTTSTASSLDNDADGAFAGIYGRVNFDNIFLNFGLTAGASRHQNNRAFNGGIAKAEFNSTWVSPEITLGFDYDLTNGWVATPSVRLAYASQTLDAYTETGAATVSVGKRQVGMAELGLEWAATQQTETGALTGRIGYAFRASTGNSTTNITQIGITKSVANNAKDRHVAYLGGEALFALNDVLDLELAGQVEFSKDHTGGTGGIKLIGKF